jgi:hypothetical protein
MAATLLHAGSFSPLVRRKRPRDGSRLHSWSTRLTCHSAPTCRYSGRPARRQPSTNGCAMLVLLKGRFATRSPTVQFGFPARNRRASSCASETRPASASAAIRVSLEPVPYVSSRLKDATSLFVVTAGNLRHAYGPEITGEVLGLLEKGLGCTLAGKSNPRGSVWRPASSEGAPRWREYRHLSGRASI